MSTNRGRGWQGTGCAICDSSTYNNNAVVVVLQYLCMSTSESSPFRQPARWLTCSVGKRQTASPSIYSCLFFPVVICLLSIQNLAITSFCPALPCLVLPCLALACQLNAPQRQRNSLTVPLPFTCSPPIPLIYSFPHPNPAQPHARLLTQGASTLARTS
jgi:hypothetical protein